MLDFNEKMKINKLTVKNFRNLKDQTIEFAQGLNVICGANGAGKTNILEAMRMCSIGRSPRTRKDTETIQTGKKNNEISITFSKRDGEHMLGMSVFSNKGKIVQIDGQTSTKVSDIVGNFPSVYFSPDEIDIVRGGPVYRRRYMDMINCQTCSWYLRLLNDLQNSIKQRNALLRSIKLNPRGYDSTLIPWDLLIGRDSIRVMLRRKEMLRWVNDFAAATMRLLTDDKETLRITYKTFFDRLDDIHASTFNKVYTEKMRASYLRDITTGTTNVGAHLDDFEIKLGYITQTVPGGDLRTEKYRWIPLRTEGSLGQQRTAALALKIAEMFMYKKFFFEKPVLFLDDVLSELDENRRHRLMKYCKNFNTVITCTEWDYPAVPDKLFKVEDGVVKEMNIRA